MTLLIMLTIVLFNLLVPHGRVLYSFGPLVITSGALRGGIHRAVTLEGLFMLSRFCVRHDLALPGTLGKFAGESFRIFSSLENSLGEITKKNIFNLQNWAGRIDELLITQGEKVWPSENSRIIERPKTLGPKFLLAAAIILAWLPFILSFR